MFYKFDGFTIKRSDKGDVVTMYYKPRGILSWFFPVKLKKYWKNGNRWRNTKTMEETRTQQVVKLNDIELTDRVKQYVKKDIKKKNF